MPDSTKASDGHEGDPLTPRELELLALVAGGLATADIAKTLGITLGTVKAHLSSVYKKIRVQNRVQAARYYLDRLRQDPAMQDKVRPGQRPRDGPRRGARLTRREFQVLELIAAGETTDAIARELGLSTSSIKTYLTGIYRKTGSQNRIQAARYYLRHYGTAATAQLSNLEDDIADIKARLHELRPALDEAHQLQDALEALEAARSALNP